MHASGSRCRLASAGAAQFASFKMTWILAEQAIEECSTNGSKDQEARAQGGRTCGNGVRRRSRALLPKQNVVGSSPITRSSINRIRTLTTPGHRGPALACPADAITIGSLAGRFHGGHRCLRFRVGTRAQENGRVYFSTSCLSASSAFGQPSSNIDAHSGSVVSSTSTLVEPPSPVNV